MRLQEYGRNPKARKEYVQQPGLLLVGVDVSQAKHSAYIGTQTGINCRKLAAIALLVPRPDFQLLRQLPRIGTPPPQRS